jgi:hypothetical protein
MFNNEIDRFFPIGKGLGIKEKGFAKRERFSHQRNRFCQEVEV